MSHGATSKGGAGRGLLVFAPRIRLNMSMRLPSWARVVPLVLMATAVLAAGCARSGYQYVEYDDENVFIKVPEDWDVVSEGNVDFAITPDDNPQVLPGERLLPWRAQFDAAPDSLRNSLEYVSGFVEVQPVDRRMRSDLNPLTFFPIDSLADAGGVEVVRHDLVRVGDVSGHRIAWRQVAEDGTELIGDRLVMTNSLNSVVYTVGFACAVGCYDANAADIDEVMRTFTVED